MFTDIHEYMLKPIEDRKSHLNLNEACIEIGGDSETSRGLLAFILKTTIPKGRKINLCHACNNAKCSNPNHLYWGTCKENQDDSNVRQLGSEAAKKRNSGLKRTEEYKKAHSIRMKQYYAERNRVHNSMR